MLYVLAFFIAASEPPVVPADGLEPPSSFDEPLSPLAPKRLRSEEDAAKLASTAFYAHGRVLLKRRDFSGALRRYQRAWRYHPEAVSILPEIVFLAHRLRRRDETARYALLAAERTEIGYPLLLRLAGWLNDQKDWQGAIHLYEKALLAKKATSRDEEDLDVGSVLLHFELGRLYFLTKESAKSADSFVHVREALENPERLSQNESLQKMVLGQADRTYQLLAESFLQAGRHGEAAAMFKKANEAQENDGLLAFHLARVAAERGKTKEALRQLDGYLHAKLNVAGTEPYQLLADLLEKTIEDEGKAKQQLQSQLQELLKADASNAPLIYFLAQLHRKNQRWAEAEKLLDELAKLKPSLEVYEGLIEVYQQQGRHDELIETLAEGVALAGSIGPLGEAAEKLEADNGLIDKLIAVARKRLDQDGDKVGAGVPLAAAWLALGDEQYDVADEFFDISIQATEESSKSQVMLSWGLEMLLAKQYERAAAVFRRALDEKVADEREDVCQFYLIRALALAGKTGDAIKIAKEAAADHTESPRIQAQPGWVLYYARRYADAEKHYLALLKEFDDKHDSIQIRDELRDARLILSNICVELDRMAEAEERLEQVLDEFPEDIGALNDLGYLWTEQGKNLNRALDMIGRAVDGDSENVAYVDSLGWAYYQLGRYQEAVKELEKAVSFAEDPDGVILDHLGDAYLKADQREKAIQTWRQAAESFGKNKDSRRRKITQDKIKKHEK